MKISKQKLIEALEKEKIDLNNLQSVFDRKIYGENRSDLLAIKRKQIRECTRYNSGIDKAISIVNSMKGEE